MKSIYKPIAIILILLMLGSCGAPVDVPETPDPSEAAHTAAPTETVTAAPADTPAPTVTPEPTTAPTETPIPTPTPNPFLPPQLGNLIGGPILPEPYKYFVLKGEGDLFYVYDTMGELIKIIADGGYYYDRSPVGIYSEYGMIGQFSFKLMDSIENYDRVADFVLHLEDGELIEIMDAYYENPIPIKQNGLGLGKHGGVLRIDGKYLLLEAEYNAETGKMDYGRCIWLDDSGTVVGEFDPAPFGVIRGVLAEKYLICEDSIRENSEFSCKVVTLDGEVLISDIEPVTDGWFWHDYEEALRGIGWYCISFDCVKVGEKAWCRLDRYGRFVPCEEYPNHSYYPDITTDPVKVSGFQLITDHGYGAPGVYAGIKRGGNWLFKIYDPSLVSDSQRTEKHAPDW